MQVRPATIHDTEPIRQIYNAEVTGTSATFDLRPRSSTEQRRWIEKRQGVHPALVAEVEGSIAGFGSLSPYRDRPAYSTTVEDSVYVAGDRRRQGVGIVILNSLVEAGQAHGFHTVIARVASENTGSIALHQACGFVVAGVEKEVGRKFGRWLDVTVLQRML